MQKLGLQKFTVQHPSINCDVSTYLEIDDQPAPELLGDIGVFSVVQAFVRPVLERLFLVLFDEPGRPHHHGRPKHYLPVADNSLAFLQRRLRRC